MTLEVGGGDTLEDFSERLRGMNPGEEKEFDVHYPEDHGQPKLAGKTVRFRAQVKGVRRKELPEINDEFAEDLGDFRTVDELREAGRSWLIAQRPCRSGEHTTEIQSTTEPSAPPRPEALPLCCRRSPTNSRRSWATTERWMSCGRPCANRWSPSAS